MFVLFQPQNLVLMSEFPHGEVKLCDLGISRYISQGADIRDILGTPDYVGKLIWILQNNFDGNFLSSPKITLM
jgi:hypothetical protein